MLRANGGKLKNVAHAVLQKQTRLSLGVGGGYVGAHVAAGIGLPVPNATYLFCLAISR